MMQQTKEILSCHCIALRTLKLTKGGTSQRNRLKEINTSIASSSLGFSTITDNQSEHKSDQKLHLIDAKPSAL